MPCSDETFETVWIAFDKARGPTVEVPRAALEQFIACHRLNYEHEPTDLVHHAPRAHAKNIECNRAPLFAILRAHTCAEPPKAAELLEA